MHGTLHRLVNATGSFTKRLWQHKAEYFKCNSQANDFSSQNRSYKIECAKAGYARNWSLRLRMVFNSYPSWRFKYSHGKREDLDFHSYFKDLFYPIIIIVTAWDKDCTLYFIFQWPGPFTEDLCSLRSNEMLFRKLFKEAILCSLSPPACPTLNKLCLTQNHGR